MFRERKRKRNSCACALACGCDCHTVRPFRQVREFAETFAGVGLPAHYPNSAYGLAEHTVGCSAYSPNLEGGDLASISDELLEASGDLATCDSMGITVRS